MPPAALPGDIIGEKRIGPAGGSLVVPGQVTVEFPPGALKNEERITVRRAQGSSAGMQFVFIAREGGKSVLDAVELVGGSAVEDGAGVHQLLAVRAKQEDRPVSARSERLGQPGFVPVPQHRILDHAALEHLAGLVERGELRAVVAETFPLEDAVKAHEVGESNRTAGKLVLTL